MFVIDRRDRQFSLEGLWFSDPAERITLNLRNQPGDPTSHLPVGGQPELEVVNRQRISLWPYSAFVS
jgi:hypothetical protein